MSNVPYEMLPNKWDEINSSYMQYRNNLESEYQLWLICKNIAGLYWESINSTNEINKFENSPENFDLVVKLIMAYNLNLDYAQFLYAYGPGNDRLYPYAMCIKLGDVDETIPAEQVPYNTQALINYMLSNGVIINILESFLGSIGSVYTGVNHGLFVNATEELELGENYDYMFSPIYRTILNKSLGGGIMFHQDYVRLTQSNDYINADFLDYLLPLIDETANYKEKIYEATLQTWLKDQNVIFTQISYIDFFKNDIQTFRTAITTDSAFIGELNASTTFYIEELTKIMQQLYPDGADEVANVINGIVADFHAKLSAPDAQEIIKLLYFPNKTILRCMLTLLFKGETPEHITDYVNQIWMLYEQDLQKYKESYHAHDVFMGYFHSVNRQNEVLQLHMMLNYDPSMDSYTDYLQVLLSEDAEPQAENSCLSASCWPSRWRPHNDYGLVQLIPDRILSIIYAIFRHLDITAEYLDKINYKFCSFLGSKDQIRCSLNCDTIDISDAHVPESAITISAENEWLTLYQKDDKYIRASKVWDFYTKPKGNKTEMRSLKADNIIATAFQHSFQPYINQELPIGFIYTSCSSENPETILGYGTWEPFSFGQTLVGFKDSDADYDETLKTGGEKTHTLTVNELPPHIHTYTRYATNNGNPDAGSYTGGSYYFWKGNSQNNIATSSLSTIAKHNNISPYITVYMFTRIK